LQARAHYLKAKLLTLQASTAANQAGWGLAELLSAEPASYQQNQEQQKKRWQAYAYSIHEYWW
jgi:hypothetical protein